jgi:hypothetical protein
MLALHHTPFASKFLSHKKAHKSQMEWLKVCSFCASLWLIGAPGETRTHNPLLKRQVPWSSLATDAL